MSKGDRSRSVVLLDVLEGQGEFERSLLERLGHQVMTCDGPDMKTLCPLLGGRGCAKFDEAHGIVFELDLDRAQHRAILGRYQAEGSAGLPIRVVVSPEQRERYADLLAPVEVWDHSPTVVDLDGFAAQVEAADRLA
jgi:hypothetical protein